MSSQDSRSTFTQSTNTPLSNSNGDTKAQTLERHPSGHVRHGGLMQIVRLLMFTTWANCVLFTIHLTQIIGSPLYFLNKDYFYSYMSLTKQSFGLLIITLTQWFSPTIVRVSGDKSVRGQLRLSKDGLLETEFPERLILIANHQLYSDWLYLWWIAYTSNMHGHVFIILKEQLKYVPIIGPGMMFFGFVFMARNWTKDKSRLQYRLQKLKGRHDGYKSDKETIDPMWLILYPEGTNLSGNTRKKSAAWAAKEGIPDLRHLLLPRSTGFRFCLQELKGTVDWVYDCTTAYEGIPRNGYGQDYFTLRALYLQGRPPKSVNMYWRRFPVSSIPIEDPKDFEKWVKARWLEKEVLLEGYAQNGRFPADEGTDAKSLESSDDGSSTQVSKGAGFIETEVKLVKWYEIGQIFIVLATTALIIHNIVNTFKLFTNDVFLRQGLGW